MEGNQIKTWDFPSSSSSKIYQTVLWQDGSYSCNCRGWTIKKGDLPRTCTHVKDVSGKNASPDTVAKIKHKDDSGTFECSLGSACDEASGTGGSIFFKPMLAQAVEPKDLKRVLADPRYIGEPKFDGERALVFIRDHKTHAAFSRLGNSSFGKNGTGWLKDVNWPVKSAVVDGELCSEGGLATAGLDINRARKTAGLDKGLIIFDLLEIDGQDLKKGAPWHERRAQLMKSFGNFKHESITVTPVSDNPKALWKGWVEKLGGEGIMMKDRASKYVPGWRSPQWLKVKFEITVDVVVTGSTTKPTYGEKKYITAEAVLTYGWWDKASKKAVTVGQGAANAPKGKSADLLKYVGKVMELKCKGVTATGALKSATFVKFREDKSATECLMPGKEEK